MKFLKKAYDIFFEIVKYLCVIIMSCMVLIVAYTVFMRFVMNNTPSWGDEMAIVCMIWFCLLSASWAFKEGRHIRVSFWEGILPPKVYRALDLFAHVVALAVFIYIIPKSFDMISMAGKLALSGSRMPIKYLYYAEPAMFTCLVIAALGKVAEFFGDK